MDTAPSSSTVLMSVPTESGLIEITQQAVTWPPAARRRSTTTRVPTELLVGADCGAPDAVLTTRLPTMGAQPVLRVAVARKRRGGASLSVHTFRVLPSAGASAFDNNLRAVCLLRRLSLVTSPQDAYYASLTEHGRRVLVLVNPHSGHGTALRIFEQALAPWLAFAGLGCDVVTTAHAGHAIEVGRAFDASVYEGAVCISGDGVVQEFVSGLLSRPDWRALVRRVPIASVACGTANALAAGLRTSDAGYAAWCIIKRKLRPLDALLVSNGAGLRTVALCGVGWGIPADIAASSESHRWMGTARYAWLKLKYGVSIMLGHTWHTARLQFSADTAMDDVALAAYFAQLQLPSAVKGRGSGGEGDGVGQATRQVLLAADHAALARAVLAGGGCSVGGEADAGRPRTRTEADRIAVLAVDISALTAYTRGSDVAAAAATAVALTSLHPTDRGVGRVLGQDSIESVEEGEVDGSHPLHPAHLPPLPHASHGVEQIVAASASGAPVADGEAALYAHEERPCHAAVHARAWDGSILPSVAGTLGMTNVTEATAEVVRHMKEEEALARLAEEEEEEDEGQDEEEELPPAYSPNGVEAAAPLPRPTPLRHALQPAESGTRAAPQTAAAPASSSTQRPSVGLSPSAAMLAGFGRLGVCGPRCASCTSQGRLRYIGHRREAIVLKQPRMRSGAGDVCEGGQSDGRDGGGAPAPAAPSPPRQSRQGVLRDAAEQRAHADGDEGGGEGLDSVALAARGRGISDFGGMDGGGQGEVGTPRAPPEQGDEAFVDHTSRELGGGLAPSVLASARGRAASSGDDSVATFATCTTLGALTAQAVAAGVLVPATRTGDVGQLLLEGTRAEGVAGVDTHPGWATPLPAPRTAVAAVRAEMRAERAQARGRNNDGAVGVGQVVVVEEEDHHHHPFGAGAAESADDAASGGPAGVQAPTLATARSVDHVVPVRCVQEGPQHTRRRAVTSAALGRSAPPLSRPLPPPAPHVWQHLALELDEPLAVDGVTAGRLSGMEEDVAAPPPTYTAVPPHVAVRVGSSHRGFPTYAETGEYVTIGCVNVGPDAPFSHASDGYMDVVVARRGGVRATLALLLRYLAGTLLCGVTSETASPLYDYLKVRSVTLTPLTHGGVEDVWGDASRRGREGPGSRVCNVDGEVLPGPGPFRAHCMPSLLTAYGEL